MNIWNTWEDYGAGLFATRSETRQIQASMELLRDPERFSSTASEMLQAWPLAATHNLRALQSGHYAWIGQASCCYAHGATSQETRLAWGQLSNAEQTAADAVADRVRREWISGVQTLLGN